MAVFPINVFPTLNTTNQLLLYRKGHGGFAPSECEMCSKTCCKKHPKHKKTKFSFDKFLMQCLGIVLFISLLLCIFGFIAMIICGINAATE